MKRILEHYLSEWKRDPSRKSLIIRGARQVGKTYTARKFGETFANTVEVNFERTPALGSLFELDLDPGRIVRDLSLATDQQIQPGRTLLFLDEVQQVPKALTSLRYFNEDMPELHVVAAGSLVDFAIEEVGIPVGRVIWRVAAQRRTLPCQEGRSSVICERSFSRAMLYCVLVMMRLRRRLWFSDWQWQWVTYSEW